MYFLLDEIETGGKKVIIIESLLHKGQEIPVGNDYKKRGLILKRCITHLRQSEPGKHGRGLDEELMKKLKHIETQSLETATQCFIDFQNLSEDEKLNRAEIIERTINAYLQISDAEEVIRLCDAYLNEFLSYSYLYPTMWLEYEVSVTLYKELCNIGDTGGKVDLQRMVYRIREEKFIHSVCSICDMPEDSELYIEVCRIKQNIINFLPIDLLEPYGAAVGSIYLNQENLLTSYAQIAEKFKQRLTPIQYQHLARAVIDLANNGVDGFENRLQVIELECSECHHALYAMQLKVVHAAIRQLKPTPALANKQAALLEKLRQQAKNGRVAHISRILQETDENWNQQQELKQIEYNRSLQELIKIDEPIQIIKNRPLTKHKKKNVTKRNIQPKKKNANNEIMLTVKQTYDPSHEQAGLKNYLLFIKKDFEDLHVRLGKINVSDYLQDDFQRVAVRIMNSVTEIVQCLTQPEFDSQVGAALARAVSREYDEVRALVNAWVRRDRDITLFDLALRQAISFETVQYGRRQGGVIAAQLGQLEWDDISACYHGYVLPNIYQIIEQGLPRYLCDDEGIALYVTLSSQSGYNFDISGHLWQRQSGKNTALRRDDGFVNREDWYDTLVPCFVLHVPF